jgi:hypothetical protein
MLNSKKSKQDPERLISLEQTISSLKRPIVIIALVGVIANLSLLGLEIMVLRQEGEKVSYNAFEACHIGMKSIFQNDPNSELINEKVMKDLEKEVFKVDSIHLVKVIDSFNCDVFSKDPKGVRRYHVALEKNSRFTHRYRIMDIREKKVDSRYQL